MKGEGGWGGGGGGGGGVSHELFSTRTFPFGHYLFTVILKWKSSLVCYTLVNEYTLECQFRKCPRNAEFRLYLSLRASLSYDS